MKQASLFHQPTPSPTPAATPEPVTKYVREYCPRCGAELCIFWQSKAWCVRCDDAELFPEIEAHRERVAGIARKVGGR